MTTKLSTKGQVVLPKQARMRLHLRPGVKLICRVEGDSIVLTPEQPATEKTKLIRHAKTGLMITKSPAHVHVTSEGVRAALLGF